MRNASIGLTCLLLLSCAGSESDGDGATLDRMSREFRVVEDLRIDGYAADLVPITRVAVAENGTIAVLQAQDHKVRFFDASGTALGEIGGSGEGPGEFTFMGTMGWVADTLWIYDSAQRRFTLVSPALEFVRNVIAPAQARPRPEDADSVPEYRGAIPQHLFDDGTVFAAVMSPSTGEPVEAGERTMTYARLTPDGVIQSIMVRYPMGRTSVSITTATGTAGSSMPFAIRPTIHVSPDGSRIAVAKAVLEGPDAETFTVTVLSAGGDTAFSRVYPFDGIPIPGSVADSVIEARARSLEARIPALADAYRKEARVPPFYPPVEEILNGRDGTVWVRMRETPEGRSYLVLDPDGDPLGTVVLPSSNTVSVADLTTIWALESDENDVESVIRYRVVRD